MNEMKEKIRKLMKLAEDKGATEHEATRAMELASSLMLKYNIELDPETDELKPIPGNNVKGFTEAWHMSILSACGHLYTCKTTLNKWDETCRFYGRPENVSAAEMTYPWLVEQVENLYKSHLPKGLSKSDRAEFRRTFKMACAMRVSSRAYEFMQSLKDDNKALEYTGSRALVVVNSIKQQLDEAEELMFTMYPKMKPAIVKVKKYGSGTRAGFEAGDKVQLHKQLQA